MTVKVQSADELSQAATAMENRAENMFNVSYSAPNEDGEAQSQDEDDPRNKPLPAGTPTVGRNEACPCGSGKKFKQCHGKLN
jgi:preprotein translocase subunit SecA